MKRFVDRVLVIFPFEEALYRRAGVPVEFVGHPLVDLVRVKEPRAALLREHGLEADAPTVALLPGSRPNELRRIIPDMAASLPLIRARVPGVQFLVAAAPNLPDDELFAPADGRADRPSSSASAQTTCSPHPTWSSPHQARRRCRRPFTSARWSSCIGSRRSPI